MTSSHPPSLPSDADACVELGKSLRSAGRADDAIAAFRRAIALRPDHAPAQKHLGISLQSRGDLPGAIQCFRKAVELNPQDAESWSNLGGALYSNADLNNAAEALERSLVIDPDSPAALSNLGVVYMALNKWRLSAEMLRRAEKFLPNNPQIALNLSAVLGIMGDFDQRVAYLDKAAKFDPKLAQSPQYQWSQSMIHLTAGDLARGWAEYECRFQIPGLGVNRDFPQPRWTGAPAPGKTILIHAEGGFGDTIYYARFLHLIPRHGEKIVVEIQRELIPLFHSMPNIERIVPKAHSPLPPFDLQFPLQSLPWLQGTTLQTLPAGVPYLAPSPRHVEKWKPKIIGDTTFKVGLVWAGSKSNMQSYQIEIFAPLAEVKNVRFFSLQKGPRAGQTPPRGMELVDFMSEVEDFADTAAIMQNLDLIISVDSSPAHLAGALGLPVWVLIPICPYFIYMLNRSDCPHYPTMRLFRQTRIDSWTEPVAAMAEALRAASRRTSTT